MIFLENQLSSSAFSKEHSAQLAQLSKKFSQLSSLSSAKFVHQLSSAQIFFSKFATLGRAVQRQLGWAEWPSEKPKLSRAQPSRALPARLCPADVSSAKPSSAL